MALLAGPMLAAGSVLGARTLAVPSSPPGASATAGAGTGFKRLELRGKGAP
jgi:hypothetical protein